MSKECFRLFNGLDENKSPPSSPSPRLNREPLLRLFPSCVMSLSCRPALLCRPPWLDNELLRGVKNLVNRFGVTVGGFFGLSVLERKEDAASLRDFNGDEGRMSWSTRMVERHSDWLS